MTNAGPWLDNGMWTPEEQGNSPVVREHYFMVTAEVRADGTKTWYIAEPTDLNLIYLVDKDEWVMVSHTPETEKDDEVLTAELGKRLS